MTKKEKILLAIGERSLETFLRTRLSDEFIFVKEASYREIVIKRIEEEGPDIVLLREALKGSMDIENLVLDIRESFPNTRIVFYTSKYRPGEPLLRKLVSYGVYDFIAGEAVTESQIFEGLKTKKQLSDVRQFLDAPTLNTEMPAMTVTTEYKDLRQNESEPNYPAVSHIPDEATPIEEESEEKEKIGVIGRLFGGKKKKKNIDKTPKIKQPKKKTNKSRKIEIDENPDDEKSFWGDVDELANSVETEPVQETKQPDRQQPKPSLNLPDIPEKNEDSIELGGYNNPLPMFNHAKSEPTQVKQVPKEPQRKPVTQMEEVPAKPDNQPSVVVEESESIEEDLFGGHKVVPERTLSEETSAERLTIPARGKPSADDVSLHQRELNESGLRNNIKSVETYVEPEIDFNPMDLDPVPKQREAVNNAQQPVQPIEPQPVLNNPKHNVHNPQRTPREPIEHNEEQSIGWGGRKKVGKIHVRTKQIVTFVSAVHGSGNTHVAFNTALKLADEGNRVLYLDMNPTFSSVDFSFQLGTWQQGIDKALEDIKYNQGATVSDNILRIKDLKKTRKEKQFKELYKSLPNSLDYMFYSQDYQTLEEQHEVPKEKLKDLIMYLSAREDYDVLIIDSEPLGEVGVDGLLNIANKIYITMTQDPGQMGVFHRQFDAAKNRVNITKNRYIIVNQFVNTEPTVKRVQKWTNEWVLQTVPFTHKGVIQANYLGEPFVLKTKHQPAKNAFESLAEHIAE